MQFFDVKIEGKQDKCKMCSATELERQIALLQLPDKPGVVCRIFSCHLFLQLNPNIATQSCGL